MSSLFEGINKMLGKDVKGLFVAFLNDKKYIVIDREGMQRRETDREPESWMNNPFLRDVVIEGGGKMFDTLSSCADYIVDNSIIRVGHHEALGLVASGRLTRVGNGEIDTIVGKFFPMNNVGSFQEAVAVFLEFVESERSKKGAE